MTATSRASRRIIFSRLAIAFGMAAFAGTARAVEAPTVATIVHAWQARARAINAFQCQAFVESEQLFAPGSYGKDPLASGDSRADKKMVRVRYELTLKGQGFKMALTKIGERHDAQVSDHVARSTEMIVCNGKETYALHTDASRPVPTIGSVERDDRQKYQGVLIDEVEPAWVWYDPLLWLEASDYDPSTLAVSSAPPNAAGSMALKVRGKSATPQFGVFRTATLFVDATEPYVIRRLVEGDERRGHDTIDLKYADSAVAGQPLIRPLSSWDASHFDEDGRLISRRRGYVSQMTCPVSFTSRDFTVAFPVGTHFSERHTTKTAPRWGVLTHWLQKTESERVQLRMDEFGKASLEKSR